MRYLCTKGREDSLSAEGLTTRPAEARNYYPEGMLQRRFCARVTPTPSYNLFFTPYKVLKLIIKAVFFEIGFNYLKLNWTTRIIERVVLSSLILDNTFYPIL